MFVAFIVLMSWRLSGVTAHEWIGLSLIAMILTHLVVHWGWVEGSVSRLARHRHGVIPLLLNTALFFGMGTALVSGVVISRVVFPNQLLPGDYLHWHSLHETASTITLFILGLHVALNWDRIRNSVRRLFDTTARPRSRGPIPYATTLRRLAWVLGVSAVLVAGVFVFARVTPSRAQVLMTFPDGHTALVGPPPDIAKVRPGTTAPNPMGTPKFVLSFVMLLIAAVVGRKVLRLRLTPRPTKRNVERSARVDRDVGLDANAFPVGLRDRIDRASGGDEHGQVVGQ